jgi:predicted fused transcriptional regulator/phosphomethylpyrimidine kinase
MVAYLDDILIYSKIKKKHIKHVITVLEALEKTDIKINSAKNIFYVQCVNFLGYIFIINEIKMDLVKIATIKDWLTPKHVTEI